MKVCTMTVDCLIFIVAVSYALLLGGLCVVLA